MTDPTQTAASCGCVACQDVRRLAIPCDGNLASLTARLPGNDPHFRYACEICGNKRCPHHTDHRLACTGSNAIGQRDAQTAAADLAAAITKGETNPDVLIVKYGPQIGRGAIRSVLSVTYPPGSAGAAAADLAAAVVEFGERLPGWGWATGHDPAQGAEACCGNGDQEFEASGASPAAALRAVMQQALDARGERG